MCSPFVRKEANRFNWIIKGKLIDKSWSDKDVEATYHSYMKRLWGNHERLVYCSEDFEKLWEHQYGQQQTQREQDIINQAVQNYANAQQYPMQQLGMYNALLRGYNTPTSASTQYQAAPSAMSQVGGLAATALGAYGAGGGFKRKGGAIKEKTYKAGGLVDLAIANALEGDFKRVD